MARTRSRGINSLDDNALLAVFGFLELRERWVAAVLTCGELWAPVCEGSLNQDALVLCCVTTRRQIEGEKSSRGGVVDTSGHTRRCIRRCRHRVCPPCMHPGWLDPRWCAAAGTS